MLFLSRLPLSLSYCLFLSLSLISPLSFLSISFSFYTLFTFSFLSLFSFSSLFSSISLCNILFFSFFLNLIVFIPILHTWFSSHCLSILYFLSSFSLYRCFSLNVSSQLCIPFFSFSLYSSSNLYPLFSLPFYSFSNSLFSPLYFLPSCCISLFSLSDSHNPYSAISVFYILLHYSLPHFKNLFLKLQNRDWVAPTKRFHFQA